MRRYNGFVLEKEQIALIRSLKGAAASIVLALYLAGIQMTGSELRVATGYAEDEIVNGLELLKTYELIEIEDYYSRSTTHALFLSSSSRYSLRSYNILYGQKEEEEVFKGGAGGQNHEEQSDRSLEVSGAKLAEGQESALPGREALLRSLGIGPGSKKMAELLAADIDEGTIRRWGIERRWWRKERAKTNARFVAGRSMFTIGTLIRILLDGDRPPLERCAECLERLPCYCGLVES